MRSYLSRLKVDLGRWQSAGIISEEQHQRILALYNKESTFTESLGISWLGLLAGLSVTIGISLIVAANWKHIPDAVKVYGFVAIFAGIGHAAIRTTQTEHMLKFPLQVLWFFLPLIGIGLFAQVFQLSGDPVRPFFVWLALTLPVAWLMVGILPTVHACSLMLVLMSANFGWAHELTLVEWRYSKTNEVPAWNWLFSLAIVAIALAEAHLRMPRKLRGFVLGLVLVWLNFCFIFKTALFAEHEGWMILSGHASILIWAYASRMWQANETGVGLPTKALGAYLYTITFAWHARKPIHDDTEIVAMILILILTIGAVALIVRAPKNVWSEHQKWDRLAKGILLISLVNSALFISPWVAAYKLAAVVANFLLVAIGIGLLWYGASVSNNIKQINYGSALLFVVLITRFFDVFGSFLKSGIGFIFTGIVLFGLATLLQKGRKKLIEQTKGAQP